MKTKSIFLKIVILSLIFLSLILCHFSCDLRKENTNAMSDASLVFSDTISIPDILSDENDLLKYSYGRVIWGEFSSCTVPAGSEIEIKWQGGKRYVTVTRNDFVVLKSDIFFSHPFAEDKGITNLLFRCNTKVIEIDRYKVERIFPSMDAKMADKFINFAELTVFEVSLGIPYLISNLEEWNQLRDYGMLKEDDLVFFNHEFAKKYCKKEKLSLSYLTSEDIYSNSPKLAIYKKGNLVGLLTGSGNLWRTREESEAYRKR